MSSISETFTPSIKSGQTAMIRARARLGSLVGVSINSPMDEVRLTQTGVSVSAFETLKQFGATPTELSWIIKPRTLTHRKSKKEPLTPEESGRWLRAAKIQALAIEVFGDQAKANAWLHKSRQQFGQQSPLDLIKTEAGAVLVEDLLNQIDAGYFA